MGSAAWRLAYQTDQILILPSKVTSLAGGKKEIAEEHLFVLNAVHVPNVAYTARRNDSADAFPVKRPRLYHFSMEQLPQSRKESLAFCTDVAAVGDKAATNAWKISMREGHAE